MLLTYCFAKCKKVQQGYASLLVLLADGAIVFARGTTLCSWWNRSSSGGTTLLLVPVAASYPGRWCGVRPGVPTAFYNKIQVNGLPLNATSVTLGKESWKSSKFGVTWRQGNRKSLQKDIVDFVFYNCNIISNSSMQKIIRTSLEVYIGWKRLQNKEISRRRENIFLLFSAGFSLSGCEEELGKEATATSASSFLVRKCSRTVVGSWTMCVLK